MNGHAVGIGLTIELQADLRVVAGNRALPSGEVFEHTMEIAREIAANVAPMSAALCKQLLWDNAIHG